MTLPPKLRQRLTSQGLDPDSVLRLIRTALAEDLPLGGSDVTTLATIPPGREGEASVVARSPGVVAGLSVTEAVFVVAGGCGGSVDPVQGATASTVPVGRSCVTVAGLSLTSHVQDGARVEGGQVLATVKGNVRDILTAERTALNLLCHISGIATVTAAWVEAVAGTGARIRDTRKTLPGLRALEKYAVRCGGGVNHRMSLSDAALIKDNHVAAAGSVTAALDAVRELAPDLPVEVECDTLAQVAEAVAAGADLILLDNFDVGRMRSAVELTAGRARLEASGGLRIDQAREVAATGVDFLAVGALTHSAAVLDIGLDLELT
jgi:nicotinate-nucleotide pyrophosphorylase (carboxylating)